MVASSAHAFTMTARAARTRNINDISPAGDIIGAEFSGERLTDTRGVLPRPTRIGQVDVDPSFGHLPPMATTPTVPFE
jgi:hypothetical protein